MKLNLIFMGWIINNQFGLINLKSIIKSKGTKLSRGKPVKYYSSDRIAQLMGNGLLTFIDEKTFYSDFFNQNEIVTYKNVNDLIEKILNIKKMII